MALSLDDAASAGSVGGGGRGGREETAVLEPVGRDRKCFLWGVQGEMT